MKAPLEHSSFGRGNAVSCTGRAQRPLRARSGYRALVALLGVIALLSGGCLGRARDGVRYPSLAAAIEAKAAAVDQAKGGSAKESSTLTGKYKPEPLPWADDTRRGTQSGKSPEHSLVSLTSGVKEKLAAGKSEKEIVREIAQELAGHTGDVKKIRICHVKKDEEWWIVLYRDAGGFYELKQYVWNKYNETPEAFLVYKRIPKVGLQESLNATEPDRVCTNLDPDPKSSAPKTTTAAAPEKPRVEPKVTTKPTPPATVVTRREEPKPPIIVTKEAPKATAEKTAPPKAATAPKQQLAPSVEVKKPSHASSARPADPVESPRPSPKQAAKDPTKEPPATSDRKPVSPFKTSFVQASAEPSRDKPLPVKASSKPSDTVSGRPSCFIFVYGSSMNHSELMSWLDANGYDSALILDAAPAVLDGYDFVWNYYSPSRGGGTVNLEPKKGAAVWGLLMEVEDGLLKAFDRKEGHPTSYSRGDKRLPVRRMEDGKTQFAWVYLAKPNRQGRRDVLPTEEYRKKIADAARFWELPSEYTAKVKSWPAR